MERIVKVYFLSVFVFLVSGNFLLYAQGNSSVIETIETICGTNKVKHYYSLEEPSVERHTVSPSAMGINTSVLNFHFFSEVNGRFRIYVDEELHSDIFVNTMQEDGGKTRLFDIEFPLGKDSFTLRVESLKYGCFETEARKEHPMLYVKYRKNKWSLDHNTVFEIPQFYFLRNSRNR